MKNPNSFGSIDEFVSATLLLIDKPLGWTSFDVLNKIKGFVRHNVVVPPNEHGHAQRFKIGHAGTLDPLATGLLVICTGKMTRDIDQLQAGTKEYTGQIQFGQTTPSFDLETQPEGSHPTNHLSLEYLQNKALGLVGEQLQTPPAYSAKQIDGQRAYKAARRGETIQIPAVRIEVEAFDILSYKEGLAEFRIVCSKGTYIRSLANELGIRSESGAYLAALRRTLSAPFN
ncbi:MAG: tRNA pseudouridine(55) synthase TruB, partial [Flavobacteriales bacterium]